MKDSRHRHSIFERKGPLRVIAFITLWSFLFTNIFGEFLLERAWAAKHEIGKSSIETKDFPISYFGPARKRRANKPSSEVSRVASGEGRSPSLLTPETFTLPYHLGEVRTQSYPQSRSPLRVTYHYHLGEVRTQSYPQSRSPLRVTYSVDNYSVDNSSSAPIVIHIQDAHCNYSCQHAIKNIIEYVNTAYGVDLALLEGGAGNYDLSPFTEIEDISLREKVADYFVKAGRVNGAELFAIMNPERIMLKGLEEPEAYIANLNAYRESLKSKPEVEEILADIEGELDEEKKRVYSDKLKEFDYKKDGFANERLKLNDYVSFLSSLRDPLDHGLTGRGGAEGANEAISDVNRLEKYRNLNKLTHVLELEKGIDYPSANRERKKLIDKLAKRLSKNEVEVLVSQSVQFKENKFKPNDFYTHLFDKARVTGINITKKYPNLAGYKEYLDKYETIDKYLLFHEIEALEDELFNLLADSDTQRELYKESEHLLLLKKLFSLSITRDEYNTLASLRGKIGTGKIGTVPEGDSPYFTKLTPYLETFERAYELAFERDLAFMRNIDRHCEEGAKRPTKQSQKAIIILTGGFHGENLEKLLAEKGYSYISILPKFEGGSEESPYFRILNGEMLKEEKVIREAIAEISGLAILSMFSELKIEPTQQEVNDILVELMRSVKLAEEKSRKPEPVFRSVRGNNVCFTYKNGGWEYEILTPKEHKREPETTQSSTPHIPMRGFPLLIGPGMIGTTPIWIMWKILHAFLRPVFGLRFAEQGANDETKQNKEEQINKLLEEIDKRRGEINALIKNLAPQAPQADLVEKIGRLIREIGHEFAQFKSDLSLWKRPVADVLGGYINAIQSKIKLFNKYGPPLDLREIVDKFFVQVDALRYIVDSGEVENIGRYEYSGYFDISGLQNKPHGDSEAHTLTRFWRHVLPVVGPFVLTLWHESRHLIGDFLSTLFITGSIFRGIGRISISEGTYTARNDAFKYPGIVIATPYFITMMQSFIALAIQYDLFFKTHPVVKIILLGLTALVVIDDALNMFSRAAKRDPESDRNQYRSALEGEPVRRVKYERESELMGADREDIDDLADSGRSESESKKDAIATNRQDVFGFFEYLIEQTENPQKLNMALPVADLHEQLEKFLNWGNGFRKHVFLDTLYSIFGRSYFFMGEKPIKKTVVIADLMRNFLEAYVKQAENVEVLDEQVGVETLRRKCKAYYADDCNFSEQAFFKLLKTVFPPDYFAGQSYREEMSVRILDIEYLRRMARKKFSNQALKKEVPFLRDNIPSAVVEAMKPYDVPIKLANKKIVFTNLLCVARDREGKYDVAAAEAVYQYLEPEFQNIELAHKIVNAVREKFPVAPREVTFEANTDQITAVNGVIDANLKPIKPGSVDEVRWILLDMLQQNITGDIAYVALAEHIVRANAGARKTLLREVERLMDPPALGGGKRRTPGSGRRADRSPAVASEGGDVFNEILRPGNEAMNSGLLGPTNLADERKGTGGVPHGRDAAEDIDEEILSMLRTGAPRIIEVNDIKRWKDLLKASGMMSYCLGCTLDLTGVETLQMRRENPGITPKEYRAYRLGCERNRRLQPEDWFKIIIFKPCPYLRVHESMHYYMSVRAAEGASDRHKLASFIERTGYNTLFEVGTESVDACEFRQLVNDSGTQDLIGAFNAFVKTLNKYPQRGLSQELFAWIISLGEHSDFIGRPIAKDPEEAEYLEAYMAQKGGTPTIVLPHARRFVNLLKGSDPRLDPIREFLKRYYSDLQKYSRKFAMRENFPRLQPATWLEDEPGTSVVEPAAGDGKVALEKKVGDIIEGRRELADFRPFIRELIRRYGGETSDIANLKDKKGVELGPQNSLELLEYLRSVEVGADVAGVGKDLDDGEKPYLLRKPDYNGYFASECPPESLDFIYARRSLYFLTDSHYRNKVLELAPDPSYFKVSGPKNASVTPEERARKIRERYAPLVNALKPDGIIIAVHYQNFEEEELLTTAEMESLGLELITRYPEDIGFKSIVTVMRKKPADVAALGGISEDDRKEIVREALRENPDLGDSLAGILSRPTSAAPVRAEGVDDIEVELRIMHEEQEYNNAAIIAEGLGFSMEQMAALRDNPQLALTEEFTPKEGNKPLQLFEVELLFEKIHELACQAVAVKCREKIERSILLKDPSSDIDTEKMSEKRKRALKYAEKATESFRQKEAELRELGELSPEFSKFGIGPTDNDTELARLDKYVDERLWLTSSLKKKYRIMKGIGVQKGSRVVDVGTFNSPLFGLATAMLGAHYTGFDLHAKLADNVGFDKLEQDIANQFGGSIVEITGEFSQGKRRVSEDIEDNSQDFVLIMSGALSDPSPESDAREVFREVLRVIKPGGKMVIGTVGFWPFERPSADAVIREVLQEPKWRGQLVFEDRGDIRVDPYKCTVYEVVTTKLDKIDEESQGKEGGGMSQEADTRTTPEDESGLKERGPDVAFLKTPENRFDRFSGMSKTEEKGDGSILGDAGGGKRRAQPPESPGGALRSTHVRGFTQEDPLSREVLGPGESGIGFVKGPFGLPAGREANPALAKGTNAGGGKPAGGKGKASKKRKKKRFTASKRIEEAGEEGELESDELSDELILMVTQEARRIWEDAEKDEWPYDVWIDVKNLCETITGSSEMTVVKNMQKLLSNEKFDDSLRQQGLECVWVEKMHHRTISVFPLEEGTDYKWIKPKTAEERAEERKVSSNGEISWNGKPHSAGIHHAGLVLTVKPYDGENNDSGFKAYHGETLIAYHDFKEGKKWIKPKAEKKRKVYSSGLIRWNDKRRYSVGRHHAGLTLTVEPYDGENNDSGFKAYHGETLIAYHDFKEGKKWIKPKAVPKQESSGKTDIGPQWAQELPRAMTEPGDLLGSFGHQPDDSIKPPFRSGVPRARLSDSPIDVPGEDGAEDEPSEAEAEKAKAERDRDFSGGSDSKSGRREAQIPQGYHNLINACMSEGQTLVLQTEKGMPLVSIMDLHDDSYNTWEVGRLTDIFSPPATLIQEDEHEDLLELVRDDPESGLCPQPETTTQALDTHYDNASYNIAAIYHGLIDEMYIIIPPERYGGIAANEPFTHEAALFEVTIRRKGAYKILDINSDPRLSLREYISKMHKNPVDGKLQPVKDEDVKLLKTIKIHYISHPNQMPDLKSETRPILWNVDADWYFEEYDYKIMEIRKKLRLSRKYLKKAKKMPAVLTFALSSNITGQITSDSKNCHAITLMGWIDNLKKSGVKFITDEDGVPLSVPIARAVQQESTSQPAAEPKPRTTLEDETGLEGFIGPGGAFFKTPVAQPGLSANAKSWQRAKRPMTLERLKTSTARLGGLAGEVELDAEPVIGVVVRVKPDEAMQANTIVNILQSRTRIMGKRCVVCIDDGSFSPANLARISVFQGELAKAYKENKEKAIAFILDRREKENEGYDDILTQLKNTAHLVRLRGNHTRPWHQVFMGTLIAGFREAVKSGDKAEIDTSIESLVEGASIMTNKDRNYLRTTFGVALEDIALSGERGFDEAFSDSRNPQLILDLPDIKKGDANASLRERWKAQHLAARAL